MLVGTFLTPIPTASFTLTCCGILANYISFRCSDTASCQTTCIWSLLRDPQDSLALALKDTHGRYAIYWNVSHTSSGHVWQGRYYSCPLDLSHLWAALRYTELNPVRAGLVPEADTYRWSSAAAHCGTGSADAALQMDSWQKYWDAATWREYLGAEGTEEEADAIRQSTHTGRPLGTPKFIES